MLFYEYDFQIICISNLFTHVHIFQSIDNIRCFPYYRVFSISTSVLTKGPPSEFERLPIGFVGSKSSPGIGLTVNELDETIYFSPLTETSVATWNPVSNEQR